jgi:protein tyrosine phosphatase (PTP) superfamily phosphohydrolase (DUF442 family)
MTPDLFWIPGPWRGKLAVTARPRGGDWLDDEARSWRQAGLDIAVSLLEKEEAAQLELDREGDVARSSNLQYISFPIPDRGVPASVADTLSLLKAILKALEQGKSVAVHCRQGIGRSGLIAAGVLVASGMGAGDAIAVVSSARGETIPETPAQLQWIRRLPSERLLVAS